MNTHPPVPAANACLKFPVLLCASLMAVLLSSATAFADCTDDANICQPSSTADDGTAVSQRFELDFSTSDQNLWAPGTSISSTTLYTKVVDPDFTKFQANLRVGNFWEFCLYDELRDLLSDVSLLGYGLGDVVDWFKDEFSNPCYWYGAGIFGNKWNDSTPAHVKGNFGLDVQLDFTGGRVAADLPVAVEISHPTEQTYRPGDTIVLSTSIQTNGDGSLITSTPGMVTTPIFSGSVSGIGKAEGCLDGCATATLWNFDETATASLDLPTPRLLLQSGQPVPEHLLEYVLGIDGFLGIPEIHAETTSQTGFKLQAGGADSFVDISIDLDQWISKIVKKPNLLAGGTIYLGSLGSNSEKARLSYSLINFGANVKATLSQEVALDTDFFIEFTLSQPLPYSVLQGASVVRSGNAATITVAAGQDVQLHLPATLAAEVTVSTKVYQENEFSSRFNQRNYSSMDAEGLSGGVFTPSWTIFNSRCIDLLLGEICTPKLSWDSWGSSGGPAIDATDIAEVDYSFPVYEAPVFELEGFQTFDLAPFSLIANTPPEVTPPQDIQLEAETTGGVNADSDSVLDWLATASATDNEDGELPATASALPALLEVGHSYTVTFTASDAFGATDEDTAEISVVDTLAPVLALEDLEVIAEEANGTPVPGNDGVISDWLASLIVADIADASPTVADNVPAFLNLGLNEVGFIATDFTGNQSTHTATVNVKAGFVLYAENSLRADKNLLVDSGMVVIESATSGPWLSKKAQVQIDRNGLFTAAAPLYSNSAELEKDTIVTRGFVDYQDGKGTILTQLAYPAGLYFPLDGLPDFALGSTSIMVGCDDDDCLSTGAVLEAGNYDELVLDEPARPKQNKQDKKQNGKADKLPSVLYLAGGVYSFSSIELNKNAELRFLAPTVILVSDGLQTEKEIYIGPDDSAEVAAHDIVLMFNGNDQSKGRAKSKLKLKSTAVEFDKDTVVFANLYAPNGSITLGNGGSVQGALAAENIDLGKDVSLRFDGAL